MRTQRRISACTSIEFRRIAGLCLGTPSDRSDASMFVSSFKNVSVSLQFYCWTGKITILAVGCAAGKLGEKGLTVKLQWDN